MNSHNITNESLALALMLVRDNSADYCRLCAEVYFQRG